MNTNNDHLGTVTCSLCHKTQTVDVIKCVESGWPLCCGETMSMMPQPGPPSNIRKNQFIHTFIPDKTNGSETENT